MDHTYITIALNVITQYSTGGPLTFFMILWFEQKHKSLILECVNNTALKCRKGTVFKVLYVFKVILRKWAIGKQIKALLIGKSYY